MKRRMNIKAFPVIFWRSFRNGVVDTVMHDGIEHAGYLAFLTMLAIFPFLVIVVAVIGLLGQGAAGASFINDILQHLPDRLIIALRPRITEIISGPPQGLLTFSILGALWTASSTVEGLRTTLNRAYHVATPPAYWLRRSLSILQLLIIAFLLVSAMMLVIVSSLFVHSIENWTHIQFISAYQPYWAMLASPILLGLIFLSVCSVYYVLPNVRQRFISLVPGAIFVVLLWIVAEHLLILYLSRFQQINLIYGSLGGVIAALFFSYLCNMILIFGAEFNYNLMQQLHLHIVEKEAPKKA